MSVWVFVLALYTVGVFGMGWLVGYIWREREEKP